MGSNSKLLWDEIPFGMDGMELNGMEAWNDLYQMGYRSDLTAAHNYGDEAYTLPLPAKRSQRRVVLPELTTKALTRCVVYLIMEGVSFLRHDRG